MQWDADALDRVVAAADGYPYALQLVAQGAWDAAHGHAAIADAAAEKGVASGRTVLRQLFASRWSELPDSEREYLRAVAETAPDERTGGGIAATLGRSSSQLGTRRRRWLAIVGRLTRVPATRPRA